MSVGHSLLILSETTKLCFNGNIFRVFILSFFFLAKSNSLLLLSRFRI